MSDSPDVRPIERARVGKTAKRRLEYDSQITETVLESTNEGFVVWDSKLKLVAWSKKCPDFWYNPENILRPGMPMVELLRHIATKGGFGPGDPDKLARRELRRIRKAGKDSVDEFQMRDGRVIHVQRNIMPDGGHASTYTDITERRRAEAALQESEEQYRSLIEGSIQGIVIDLDGVPMFANQAYADIFGYDSPNEILTLGTLAPLYETKERERVVQYRKNRMAGRQPAPEWYEFRGVKKDGSNIRLETRLHMVVWRGNPAIQSTVVDITELQMAKEAKERLSQAVETVSVGIALFDIDDRLIFFNNRYGELMEVMADILKPGVTFEEMIRTMVDRQPVKDALGREEEFLQERIEHHRNPTGPFYIRREDRWLMADETRLPDGSIFTIITDITNEKQAEQAQRESEDLLDSIFENVPVGLLIKDPDHIVERANSTYLSWYGFDADTMTGRRSDEIEDFQSVEEAKFMNAQERDVLTTGRTQTRQVDRPFADDQIHTIDITKFPVYDQQGNITKVGSVSIDLTEQVQAQKALAHSENRFRDAIESIPNGVAILDKNDQFVICNNAYRQHLGKINHLLVPGTPFEELVRGVAVAGIVSEAQKDAEAYIRRRMDMHRRQVPFLQHIVEGDRWVIVHDYKTADGNVFHVRTDITEQKAAEEALRESEEKHRRFSTDVAHELRTPLALLRVQFDNLENTEIIQSLKKDVDAMARLVSQIMSTTQLDSITDNPNDEADLRAIGTEVVKHLAPFAIKEGRSIELTGTEPPVIVRGNSDALEMAVRNLVENAIQYSARETMISVHVSDEPAISVTNIGQGIPPEKRNAIFQRFTRADRRSGGVGLGLSIVKRVVEAHQATIDVSDAPGGGAVFKISFPSHKNLKVVKSVSLGVLPD